MARRRPPSPPDSASASDGGSEYVETPRLPPAQSRPRTQRASSTASSRTSSATDKQPDKIHHDSGGDHDVQHDVILVQQSEQTPDAALPGVDESAARVSAYRDALLSLTDPTDGQVKKTYLAYHTAFTARHGNRPLDAARRQLPNHVIAMIATAFREQVFDKRSREILNSMFTKHGLHMLDLVAVLGEPCCRSRNFVNSLKKQLGSGRWERDDLVLQLLEAREARTARAKKRGRVTGWEWAANDVKFAAEQLELQGRALHSPPTPAQTESDSGRGNRRHSHNAVDDHPSEPPQSPKLETSLDRRPRAGHDDGGATEEDSDDSIEVARDHGIELAEEHSSLLAFPLGETFCIDDEYDSDDCGVVPTSEPGDVAQPSKSLQVDLATTPETTRLFSSHNVEDLENSFKFRRVHPRATELSTILEQSVESDAFRHTKHPDSRPSTKRPSSCSMPPLEDGGPNPISQDISTFSVTQSTPPTANAPPLSQEEAPLRRQPRTWPFPQLQTNTSVDCAGNPGDSSDQLLPGVPRGSPCHPQQQQTPCVGNDASTVPFASRALEPQDPKQLPDLLIVKSVPPRTSTQTSADTGVEQTPERAFASLEDNRWVTGFAVRSLLDLFAQPEFYIVDTGHVRVRNDEEVSVQPKLFRNLAPGQSPPLVVPICIRNCHWTSALIYPKRRTLLLYDPMSTAGKHSLYMEESKQAILQFCNTLPAAPDASDWTMMTAIDGVSQHDAFNCGILVIFDMIMRMSGLPIPPQVDLQTLRHLYSVALAAMFTAQLKVPLELDFAATASGKMYEVPELPKAVKNADLASRDLIFQRAYALASNMRAFKAESALIPARKAACTSILLVATCTQIALTQTDNHRAKTPAHINREIQENALRMVMHRAKRLLDQLSDLEMQLRTNIACLRSKLEEMIS